jgi:hypothetical protein
MIRRIASSLLLLGLMLPLLSLAWLAPLLPGLLLAQRFFVRP